jgi:hypothetical protein
MLDVLAAENRILTIITGIILGGVALIMLGLKTYCGIAVARARRPFMKEAQERYLAGLREQNTSNSKPFTPNPTQKENQE